MTSPLNTRQQKRPKVGLGLTPERKPPAGEHEEAIEAIKLDDDQIKAGAEEVRTKGRYAILFVFKNPAKTSSDFNTLCTV